jgi:hypothetical protein
MVRKRICKRHYAPNATPTAVGGARYRSTSCHRAAAVGVQSLFKNLFFCLNSDGCKIYMKIVAFDEIYNSVVQSFSI